MFGVKLGQEQSISRRHQGTLGPRCAGGEHQGAHTPWLLPSPPALGPMDLIATEGEGRQGDSKTEREGNNRENRGKG